MKYLCYTLSCSFIKYAYFENSLIREQLPKLAPQETLANFLPSPYSVPKILHVVPTDVTRIKTKITFHAPLMTECACSRYSTLVIQIYA